jgi:hypothetical protein
MKVTHRKKLTIFFYNHIFCDENSNLLRICALMVMKIG